MSSTGADRIPRPAIATETLSNRASALSDRLRVAVVAAILPVVLTSVLIGAYVGADGGSEVPRSVVDTAYGLSALAVLAGVYLSLDDREWRTAARFAVPDRSELLWTLVCLPLAVGAFVLGATTGELLGFELAGFSYSLANRATLAAVVFGGIVVAPLVEEILFRGLLLGSLLGRDLSPAVAALLSILLFAGVHIVALGIAGVLAIAGWAVFPTLLRLKFDNLTGAWLLHALNNVYSYVVVVALGLA